mmetsp:Transcript_35963/g.78714  ORF Transcript_35963/g.78714 Transcript_35963/m.78714 type:complete len:207 (-) Transcript_35963:77-697(-)
MPATAGRVPMPHGNRLSVSDSLKTHDVWQKAVGYDPYAGGDEGAAETAIPEVGEINSSAKGLFRLAQLTGNSSTLAPGACKKCGQVGHLFFQCRNYLSVNDKGQGSGGAQDDEEDEDPPSDALPSSSSSSSDDDDDDDDDSGSGSDSSDSDSDGSSEESSSSSAKKKKGKKRKKSSKKEKKASKKKKKVKKEKKEKSKKAKKKRKK